MSPILDQLRNSLIVSCQPVSGGPMDSAEIVVAFARAALAGGAGGLRIESAAYVRAVRAVTTEPVIGIVKRDLDGSPVRITPWLDDVDQLASAGADIIAFDATVRPRPQPVGSLIGRIHDRGKLAMADCAMIEDAVLAVAAGADLLGSTLSGFTGGPEPAEPDLELITAMCRLTPYTIAEGSVRTPAHAAQAIAAGAYSVVVGSAVTRPEFVTSWFRSAIDGQLDGRAGR